MGKQIWAISNSTNTKQNIEASTIDVSNFDRQSTNMVFYKVNDGQATEETKTLTVEEWEKKGRPSEIKVGLQRMYYLIIK